MNTSSSRNWHLYYVQIAGNVQGPMTQKKVKQLVDVGTLSRFDMVKRDN